MSELVWIILLWPLCAIPGAIVGSVKNAGVKGCLLGFFLGPIGVVAAFALDDRPLCCQCQQRIESFEPGFDSDRGDSIICESCGTANAVPDKFAQAAK